MRPQQTPAAAPAHDAIDMFVATVASWCERLFSSTSASPATVSAFTDEAEREQIRREFHLN